MKNKCKVLLLTLFIVMIMVMSAFLMLGIYYHRNFAPNTWINDVYCTGKSVEEVNGELLSQIKAPVITIVDIDGTEQELRLDDMDYLADFGPVLQEFIKKQNPWYWPEHIMHTNDYVILPAVTYDESILKEEFSAIPSIQTALLREERFCLEYTETEGYRLYDGVSQRLDTEKAFSMLKTAIAEGETVFCLDDDALYYDGTLTEEQEKTKVLWEKLQNFYQCDIVYDMGTEQIPLTPKILSGFLKAENGEPLLGENGELLLEEEGVKAFIASLAEHYDTYQNERQFQSTRGDIVTITKGTYGTRLNQTKEVAYLMQHLLLEEMHTGNLQMHVPAYSKEPYVRGMNDIGDTYIEIDLTEQKLYFYEKGKLEIETDVVTGDERQKMSTPEGIYFVYAMQRDRTLRGEGYASFVKYWMPVNKGIGLHDANWRNKFGGEIYKKNGSHGCINIPPSVMPDIYDKAEIGLPVIIIK